MARLFLLAIALVLAGCAADPKPAICDGKHRRPANPYGSVLPNAPASASPAPPTPGPRSSLDPASYSPCGARA